MIYALRWKSRKYGKRKYRKKANAVRLCTDDLFNRQTLISYHDGYAKVMAKYGLQRGVRGSEARHTTTTQYYRELKKMNDTLEMESKRLQEQETEAEQIGLSAMEFAELIKGRIVNFTGRLFYP